MIVHMWFKYLKIHLKDPNFILRKDPMNVHAFMHPMAR